MVLVLLGLGLRTLWVLSVETKPVGDFAMYLESAAHLREHGALDDAFIYMPGYVLLLALVQTMGGGLLACKMIGAVLGATTVGLVYGITRRLWDGRAAVVAGALCALWPGGVMVASVTGTDTPATTLMVAGIYLLLRWGRERPWRAAIAFGIGMGLASYVRAVALPLTAFGFFYFLSVGRSVRLSLLRTAAATIIALVVLLPWGIRNRTHYGEWIFTDSHGGLTALVGAYPNSDGHYTRALNRTFLEVTGMQWLQPPHRKADKTAYALAKEWTAFDRAYALGLAMGRAHQLLDDERSLLYWPLYRQAVLQDGQAAFWNRWRSQVENLVDGFYWAVCMLGLAGLAVAVALRRWPALTLLPFQAALSGVYVLYFAESRYHLPIFVLMLPAAAGAVTWLFDFARTALGVSGAQGRARWKHAVRAVVVTPVAALALFHAIGALGADLRDRHRWAVHRCTIGEQATFCRWRRSDARATPSPVLGVFDGVGLQVRGAQVIGASGVNQTPVAAETVIDLPVGTYRVSAQVDATGTATHIVGRLQDALSGKGADVGLGDLLAGGKPIEFTTNVAEGRLILQFQASSEENSLANSLPNSTGTDARVWLTNLVVKHVP